MNDEKLGFEDDLMLGVPAGGGRAVSRPFRLT